MLNYDNFDDLLRLAKGNKIRLSVVGISFGEYTNPIIMSTAQVVKVFRTYLQHHCENATSKVIEKRSAFNKTDRPFIGSVISNHPLTSPRLAVVSSENLGGITK